METVESSKKRLSSNNVAGKVFVPAVDAMQRSIRQHHRYLSWRRIEGSFSPENRSISVRKTEDSKIPKRIHVRPRRAFFFRRRFVLVFFDLSIRRVRDYCPNARSLQSLRSFKSDYCQRTIREEHVLLGTFFRRMTKIADSAGRIRNGIKTDVSTVQS